MARDLFAEAGIVPVKSAGPRDLFAEAGIDPSRNRLRESAEGVFRGMAGIGNTILTPVRALTRGTAVGDYLDSSVAGQSEMDQANSESNYYAGGKLASEVAATWPVGGAIAAPLKSVPALAPLAEAIATGGMRAGGIRGAAGVGLRAVGGAVTGGAAAGLVNPSDALSGAAIGGAAPFVLQGAGKVGTAIYKKTHAPRSDEGRVLAKALDITTEQGKKLAAALERAPTEIVPGSQLTVSQALQTQGANDPSVKMLERIAAGGPGGDVLLKQYDSQGLARLAALEREGAQTYLGAAKEEATRAGDRIGAVLRTQAADDRGAARDAWESLYGRAARENVALHLPLDKMHEAMSPLGPGTVGAGKDARAIMDEAKGIGMIDIPAIGATKQAKQTSLLNAVKMAGGINENTISGKQFRGELQMLRQGGLGRVVYKNRGQSVERMAEKMWEAGYLPNDDPDTLINMLRDSGSDVFSANADLSSNYRAAAESAMGDAPGLDKIKVPVKFADYQRLLRSAGDLGAKVGSREGGGTEAGVLSALKSQMLARVDDAAAGNLNVGDVMPAGFRDQYMGVRDLTRRNAELYKQSNNIGSILRRPVGQDYALTGDEITNKIWHGGSGLAGDVANLRNTLNAQNNGPTMDVLRQFIMTDAASKTKGSGQLGAALPRYVETRMPGLLEALTPDQLKVVSSVAADIKNADAAAAVPGLLGSDTQAKITRAMGAGLLDAPVTKKIAGALAVKGIGAESIRSALAESVKVNKGKTIAALLADPKSAAAALNDAQFVKAVDLKTIRALQDVSRRVAPLAVSD